MPFSDTRMNEFTVTGSNQAVIQYVQFTFAENMNEFMNYRSMNAFRHNTEQNRRTKKIYKTTDQLFKNIKTK